MNKLGIVLGVTAAVTLAGCMDPNYKKASNRHQNEPKVVQTETEPQKEPQVIEQVVTPNQDVKVTVVEQKKCKCAPGTKHTKPCACGAADCACEVVVPEVKPVAPVEETTDYIVQRGDYLAKISKKYNLTMTSLRRVNPQLKGDVIKVGQKIKLPGKIDVGEQKVPAGAFASPVKTAPRAAYKPYEGKTKEYVVKSGDNLGSIAYSNGINIRQLKELNNLSSNTIRVGDKLKVPAEKVVAVPAAVAVPETATKKTAAAAKPKANASAAVNEASVQNKVSTAAPVVEKATETTNVEATAEKPAETSKEEPKSDAKDGKEEYITHVVQEGEDVLALSLRYSVGPAVIRELNNLSESDELKVNQTIRIPAEVDEQ